MPTKIQGRTTVSALVAALVISLSVPQAAVADDEESTENLTTSSSTTTIEVTSRNAAADDAERLKTALEGARICSPPACICHQILTSRWKSMVPLVTPTECRP